MVLQNKNYPQEDLCKIVKKEKLAYSIFDEDSRNTLGLVDAHMRFSDYKKGVDRGDIWYLGAGSTAIRLGVENANIPLSIEKIPEDDLDWMAEAYVVWQWETQRPSCEISEACSAQDLLEMRRSLCDVKACDAWKQLEELFFT